MGVTALPVDETTEAAYEGCSTLQTPLQHEIHEGLLLGQSIDPEDDDDDGELQSPLLLTVGDRERALAKARAMKRILLKHGVPEVSIELRPGRPNGYGVYDAMFCVADMSHHTVSRYSRSSLTPVLSLCKFGRSDLPGPLCNGYGGWDLCYRIITFGYANHPGYGGAYRVPALTAGSFLIPKDSARRYAWGTEFEGGLAERDWDIRLRNPRNGKVMTYREFMGRVNAGLEEALQIHPQAHLEHSTWTARKIDRLHYDRERGIKEKAPYRNGGVAGDEVDMADLNDIRQVVREAMENRRGFSSIIVDLKGKGGQDDVRWSLNKVFRALLNDEAHLRALVNRQSDDIVAAITAKLPTSTGDNVNVQLSEEQVKQAVRDGLVEVLGSLNDE